jgi:hypothetical protein
MGPESDSKPSSSPKVHPTSKTIDSVGKVHAHASVPPVKVTFDKLDYSVTV